jgi:hypothetical protein
MPGVDGRAVLLAARQRQPDACTVVASGRAEDEHDSLVADGACMVAGIRDVSQGSTSSRVLLGKVARGIARLEREAFVTDDPERAAMCGEALSALLRGSNEQSVLAAIAACMAELERRVAPS